MTCPGRAAAPAICLLLGAAPASAVSVTVTDANSVGRFLTPDGAVVVTLKPATALAASDFDEAAFDASYGGQFAGYTITRSGSASDAIAVGSYDAASPGADPATGLPVVGGAIALSYANDTVPAGRPHFVQFVDTNQPLGGATPPYLDPASNDDTLPFYWTEAERPGFQSGAALGFEDFSRRTTGDLFGATPALQSIDWEGELFYGQWDGATSFGVEGGLRWGWEARSATSGAATARFENPAPAGAVTSGVGTSAFGWGAGQPSSQLSFAPQPFNPRPNVPFPLGRLTYVNGVNPEGTEATSVDLVLELGFDTAPENDQARQVGFSLVNTPNTDDPVASADAVSFTFGKTTTSFNIFEGNSASADLIGIFSSGAIQPSTVANLAGKSLAEPLDFPAISTLDLKVVGFDNASEFGFIETSVIPLPPAAALLLAGLGWLVAVRRGRTAA